MVIKAIIRLGERTNRPRLMKMEFETVTQSVLQKSVQLKSSQDESTKKILLLLVVSLHQSDPLSDTFFCDIVVNHEITKRACLSQQRALEEMLHRLISFFTITRGVILICIFPLS